MPQKNSIALIRYPSFDLVRLLLALEVVVAHTWPTIDPSVGWPGFIMAVPAFLAVSGFLVLKSYATSGSWVIFTKKRALRIFPALFTSFVLGFLLIDWAFVEASFINWISGGLYGFPGLANAPLWSLAWEELAYVCLALLWTIGAYKKPLFIWALLAVSSAISAYVVHSGFSPRTQVISFLAPAFFVGNLTYIYSTTLLKLGNILPWLFFIGICAWGTSSHPVLQAFATVWAGMAGRQLLPVRIPDISYGIYIYHMPVLLYLTVVCGVTSPVTLITLMVATLVPLCLASWYLIEKPFLRLK
ncbi:acyltransferase [Pseudomonas sp. ICMP 460]|uniref:acyltransferase family protein n=1 Tax=Pseudomonas sp. ICMP 460 TaxID=1718917 RepID=UPI000C09EE2A|nr:acyltransferase [Pseudomonas sp. ICMP 460]PHN20245.1 hypothetical protein AO240_21980 [Pseudomonas sp. ICMP 460]